MAYVKPEEQFFAQYQLEPIQENSQLPIIPSPSGAILKNGEFSSPNYRKNISGWRIDALGNAEFNTINIIRAFTAGETITANDTVSVISNSNSLDLERGSSQYASITDAAQTGLDLSTAFTIEFWVRPETLTVGDQKIISKWHEGGQRSYEVTTTGTNKIRVLASDDGSIVATHYVAWSTDAAQLSDGVWAHVAVSFDVATETAVFYVNGSSVASTKEAGTSMGASIFNGTAAFAIGTDFTGAGAGQDFFDGLIDEVRVWSVVRTATEINNNYQLFLAGNETNLQGYWALDNNYEDETTNNNDLTATGAPVFSSTVGFTVTRVYRASGLTTRMSNSFIGFAITTATVGTTVYVNVGPIVELSSTSVGIRYYLSDTRGAISSSAGTVSRKIGIGLPGNDLLITNIW